MPHRSKAERDVARGSSGHCTAYTVLGAGPGTEIQGESLLEINHLYVLNTVPNIAELTEQVRFCFGWPTGKLRQHIFDVVAVLTTGERIAFAIKPEFRLNSSNQEKQDFEDEMRIVAWWAYRKGFADDVRILTEVDLDPIDLHNAKVLAAVREADPEADVAAFQVMSGLPPEGGQPLRELTLQIGMGARGYRALLRLVREGQAYMTTHERIGPKTVIAFGPGTKFRNGAHQSRMLVPDAQPEQAAAQASLFSQNPPPVRGTPLPNQGLSQTLKRRIPMARHEPTFLNFSLDKDHIYRMHSADWGFAYFTRGAVTFHAIEDPHRKATYNVGTLKRLNAEGSIEVKLFARLPEHLRPVQFHTSDDLFINQLPPATRKRLRMKHAMVQSYLDHVESRKFKIKDDQIEAEMQIIRDDAESYLVEELPDPEYDLKLEAWKNGEGPKPRSKSTVELPDKVAGGTLRKWDAKYKKGGLPTLVDRIRERGNHFSYFTVEEMSLLAEVVKKEYMTRQRKKLSTVLADVKAAFKEENERRQESGEVKLRTPGRDALRKFVNGLNKFNVLAARHGHDEAMKKMRPTFKGLDVSRPFERIEMDEWKIDLLTILAQSGLLAMFSPEEREAMGLTGALKRWWMVGAIDFRTNCLVGLALTPNPKTSSAIKCLRMVVSDKGEFADRIGTLAP